MSYSFDTIFSRKNVNLIVGLVTLLLVLWLIMFAIPSLFVNLFDTVLGNLILIAFIFLAAMHNVKLAVGLGVVFMVLFRFSHMSVSSFANII
jgi:hypothetical protein